MTRLEFLKNHGSIGVECGCISPDMFMKYIRYSNYLEHREKGETIEKAMELTADEHKLDGTVTIWRDRKFFQDGEML